VRGGRVFRGGVAEDTVRRVAMACHDRSDEWAIMRWFTA
jgi:hypothetical protein